MSYKINIPTDKWVTYTLNRRKGMDVMVTEPEALARATEWEAFKTTKEDRDNAIAQKEIDKANANQKLKDLGLTDDEIRAIKGIS